MSLIALIAARRFEPQPAETEAEPEDNVVDSAPSQVGGRELGIRVLALAAGAGVLFAVTGVMLGTLLGAAIAGAVGLGLLFVARYLKAAQLGPAEPETEPLDSQEDAPSLMRTELPFGPFLAAAAVFYLFAEPWIVMNFRL